MKKIYYLNNIPIAEMENGILTILDSSILLENRHSKLTCSDIDDENIKLVHHLHLKLSKQSMNNVHKKMLNSYEDESE